MCVVVNIPPLVFHLVGSVEVVRNFRLNSPDTMVELVPESNRILKVRMSFRFLSFDFLIVTSAYSTGDPTSAAVIRRGRLNVRLTGESAKVSCRGPHTLWSW